MRVNRTWVELTPFVAVLLTAVLAVAWGYTSCIGCGGLEFSGAAQAATYERRSVALIQQAIFPATAVVVVGAACLWLAERFGWV